METNLFTINCTELNYEECLSYDGGKTAYEIGQNIGEALGKAARAVADFFEGFRDGFLEGLTS